MILSLGKTTATALRLLQIGYGQAPFLDNPDILLGEICHAQAPRPLRRCSDQMIEQFGTVSGTKTHDDIVLTASNSIE